MNFNRFWFAAPVFLLAGCATHYSPAVGQLDEEDFGEANRQTYSAMIIDPDPVYNEPLEGNGERAVDAIEAYREGNVEEPESQSIGGGIGGGGS